MHAHCEELWVPSSSALQKDIFEQLFPYVFLMRKHKYTIYPSYTVSSITSPLSLLY